MMTKLNHLPSISSTKFKAMLAVYSSSWDTYIAHTYQLCHFRHTCIRSKELILGEPFSDFHSAVLAAKQLPCNLWLLRWNCHLDLKYSLGCIMHEFINKILLEEAHKKVYLRAVAQWVYIKSRSINSASWKGQYHVKGDKGEEIDRPVPKINMSHEATRLISIETRTFLWAYINLDILNA